MILHVSTVVGDGRMSMAKHIDYECEYYVFESGFLQMFRVMLAASGTAELYAFLAIPAVHIEYIRRRMDDREYSELYKHKFQQWKPGIDLKQMREEDGFS